jgi:hypothetical protein
MIGADKLVELRKEGLIPELVNVWVGDDDKYYSGEWHKYSDTQEYPEITVENKDNITGLDFRFAFGLTVFIRGRDIDRMLKVYEKINKCLPDRVLIFNHNDTAVEIMDSKGLLSGIIE